MSPAWLEMRLALVGTLRLARGDRSALVCFVASLDGFWRSFRGAAICYPLYLILLALRLSHGQPEDGATWRVFAVETIAFVISWTAFPLLVLPLSRWLGRESRFLLFMVAYNWSQVPQTVLFVAIGLAGAGGLVPGVAAQFLEFVATIAVLVYEWYIARVALSLGPGRASLVVLTDVLLGMMLGRVAQALY